MMMMMMMMMARIVTMAMTVIEMHIHAKDAWFIPLPPGLALNDIVIR
jgi:hypothetical protein